MSIMRIRSFPNVSWCLEKLYDESLQKHQETNYVANKPGCGCKSNILKTLERKLTRDVIKDPWISAKLIVNELISSGVDVSRKTVVKALHHGRLQNSIAEMTVHKCLWTFATWWFIWKSVLWSDETKLSFWARRCILFGVGRKRPSTLKI